MSSSPSSLSAGGSMVTDGLPVPKSKECSSLDSVDVTKDPYWQCDKSTVRERNTCMFNNELMSDVTIVIGGDKRIPAHRYILSTGSPVFYKMFYGPLAEQSKEITIPVIDSIGFLTLLKYLYTNSADLNDENVLSTLYASKKFLVNHLSSICVGYLEDNLNADNACVLLSHSRLLNEAKLMARCLQIIDVQAELVLSSKQFADIDFDTLKCILERDTLNCRELTVFNGAMAWSKAQCMRDGLEEDVVTGVDKRKALKDAIFLIRIPTMRLKEFANGPAQSAILTPTECSKIFLHYIADKKPNLQYSSIRRKGLRIEVCHRFQSNGHQSDPNLHSPKCDSIQFSVDKEISIVGFGLYGSSCGQANHIVQMELKRSSGDRFITLAEKCSNLHSNGSNDTFRVLFDNPMHIRAGTKYIASITLNGSVKTHFGHMGSSEVEVDCENGPVTFKFRCSPESTGKTNVQYGQLPEILFFAPFQDEVDLCGKRTEYARNTCMFNNELMSDVTIVIGGDKRIPAHRYILSTGSPVFYKMFYGPLAEQSKETTIPVIDSIGFLTLLKYLYTDSADLNDENVLSTLYASKKFLVNHLSSTCVGYLEDNLNADNACVLLSHSRQLDEKRFEARCWQVIDILAELVLSSKQFADIDFDTLKCILERDTLNCRELSVFNGAMAWSKAQCMRDGLEEDVVTGLDKRKALKDAIFLVRIPAMSLKEFATGPALSGILTPVECSDLFLYYTADKQQSLQFPTIPRNGPPLRVCNRFPPPSKLSFQEPSREPHSIKFSVDQKIFITGYGLYGCPFDSESCTVRIELKWSSKDRLISLAEKITDHVFNGSTDTFRVFFDNPIQIEAGPQYTASVTLGTSNECYSGTKGSIEVKVDCANSLVTFRFKRSPQSTHGTTVQRGQLPEILFYAPIPDVTDR